LTAEHRGVMKAVIRGRKPKREAAARRLAVR